MDNRERMTEPKASEREMRIIGYFPYWRTNKLPYIPYDNLTHLVFAFVLPNTDATLQPIPNAFYVEEVIQKAHEHGVKVLLGCGGWSSGDGFLPLEAVFKQATETDCKIRTLVENLMHLVREYKFDGIELSWLHPRYQDVTQTQYEKLIHELHKQLKPLGLLLSSSILCGVNAEGIPMYDAAAQTENAWNYLDWVSVAAYDGGDGEKHSPYELMVNACEYWRDKRGIPAEKIVASIPFYGRPTWCAYFEILEFDPDADSKDVVVIHGKDVYYNGKETVRKKAKWAKENVGGISVWELTQDSTDKEKSLFYAMVDALK